MENVHKGLKKYKCDDCGKNFKHNIGLKEHITDVDERKDSIVINVAKFLLEDVIWKCVYKLFMRKTLNSIVITVAKISPKF